MESQQFVAAALLDLNGPARAQSSASLCGVIDTAIREKAAASSAVRHGSELAIRRVS